MTTLHFSGLASPLMNRLADLMARRRIGVTSGDIALAGEGATLVALAPSAPLQQQIIQAARRARLRNLCLIVPGAEALRVTSECGGSLMRIDVPLAEDDLHHPSARLLIPYLAEILAHPIRPMVACDPATGGLIDLAQRVAAHDVSVFVNGPTGSGKEVLARAIHDASPRAKKPFIALNCAAIPENMLEAMLFGHVKGAFTGAITAGQGLIRAADQGTLLLDEISEMPLGLQAKLLRVLQERNVTPLGASAEIPVDLRIISTSNRDMMSEIALGRFREDLYYRLNVFPLHTQALVDRPEDIVPLALAFLRRHWQGAAVPLFTPGALDVLKFHTWPGNVRELENVVQRALVLCDGQEIGVHDLMLDRRPADPATGSKPAASSVPFPRALSSAG